MWSWRRRAGGSGRLDEGGHVPLRRARRAPDGVRDGGEGGLPARGAPGASGRGGSAELFRQVEAAYDVLGDPRRWQEYDRRRETATPAGRAPAEPAPAPAPPAPSPSREPAADARRRYLVMMAVC